MFAALIVTRIHSLGMTALSGVTRDRTSTSSKGLPDNYPVNPLQVVQSGEFDHKFAPFPAHVHFDCVFKRSSKSSSRSCTPGGRRECPGFGPGVPGEAA